MRVGSLAVLAVVVAVVAFLASQMGRRTDQAAESGGVPSVQPTHRLLRDTPATSWPALERWRNASYLAETWAPLHGVWLSAKPKLAYFAERTGESGMRGAPHAREDAHVEELAPLATADFLAGGSGPLRRADGRPARAGGVRHLYCHHDLRDLGHVALADVHPIEGVAVAPSEAAGRPVEPQVWLGTDGVAAHAHYDTHHSIFVQVAGRKRIWLWPTSARHALRLFPRMHSHHRASQLGAPHADAAAAGATELVLEPGDVLHVPPYTIYHAVDEAAAPEDGGSATAPGGGAAAPGADATSASISASISLSISVALRTPGAEAAAADALELLPLPWEAEWAPDRQMVAASAFLRALFVAEHGDVKGGRAAARALIDSRFGGVSLFPAEERDWLEQGDTGVAASVCGKDSLPPPMSGPIREQGKEGAAVVAAALAKVSDDPHVRALILENYAESVSAFVAGSAPRGHMLLRECVADAAGFDWQ